MDDVQGGFVAREEDREGQLASGVNRTERGPDGADSAVRGSWPASGPQDISPEERWQAIAVRAYHLARARGFAGKAVKYWLAAEAKVDAELTIQ